MWTWYTLTYPAADAMVRELDVSRITLRLREKADKKGEAKEDRILARLVGNTLDVLKSGLVGCHDLEWYFIH